VAHAGAAGRRGAVKIAFDLRRRNRQTTGLLSPSKEKS
jgi:hypothetical protein